MIIFVEIFFKCQSYFRLNRAASNYNQILLKRTLSSIQIQGFIWNAQKEKKEK